MSNVTALPGVKPRRLVNETAANQLQRIVDKLRSGELVGVAWVTLKPNGTVQLGSDFPTNMGEQIFYGIQTLSYRMMKNAND